jgi:hypothetical protein
LLIWLNVQKKKFLKLFKKGSENRGENLLYIEGDITPLGTVYHIPQQKATKI